MQMRVVLNILIAGLVYLSVERVSEFMVCSLHGIASLWPAGGFAVGILLVTRPRWWWLLQLAVFFAADVWVSLLVPLPLEASLGVAVLNLVEILLIALFLLNYLKAELNFTSISQVIGFFFLVILCSGLVGLAATLYASRAAGASLAEEWLSRWLAHALGIVLVAPAMLTWKIRQPRRTSIKPGRLVEGFLLVFSLVTVSLYLFLQPQQQIFSSVLRTYLVFPFLIWAALRFSPRFASTSMALTGLIAVIGTSFDLGIFGSPMLYLTDRNLTAQLYVGVMSFSSLLVIATIAERKHTAELLRENEQRLVTIFENSADTIYIINLPDLKITFLNRHDFLGYSISQLSQGDDLRATLHPDDLPSIEAYWGQVRKNIDPDPIEFRLRRNNGDYEWVRMGTSILSNNDDGTVAQVQVTLTDINEQKQAERVARSRLRLVEYAVSHTLEQQLQATLDEAEALTGSTVSFYHFLEDDQATISMQTWSTRTRQEYCKLDSIETHYPVDQAGVWAESIRARRPVLHNDYSQLPDRKGFPADHVDIKREMVVPLLRGDKVVCLLGLGNKPFDYTGHDAETVLQLADLTWEIIERKRAEQAQKISDELLMDTQAIAGVGGWQYDVSTGRVMWTSEMYTIHGVDKDYDHGDLNRAFGWYAPEDQPTIEQAYHQVISEGKPFELELGFINARGRRMWVRTSGKPVWEGESIIKVTGTIADITEQKQAEAALAKSEEQLRLAMDATSDGLWDWHIAENYTYYSPGYYRMLGYLPAEFPASPQAWISLVHPDDRQKVLQMDNDIVDNRIQILEVEMRIMAKNGEWKWILSRGKSVGRDANGRALRVVGTHVDITERKGVEEALRRANKKLERQAMANEALQQLLIEQATHDALTGLYNRRYMDDALERELSRARRENYPVCVMMLDIDHFKGFNDSYGHDAGDQVLMALGRLLRVSIRQSDIACRYGGEEFVIIMPGARVDDGQNRAEIIRAEFERTTIDSEGKSISATMSVGVALFPMHAASPDALLRAADAALYDAKNSGRNRISLAR